MSRELILENIKTVVDNLANIVCVREVVEPEPDRLEVLMTANTFSATNALVIVTDGMETENDYKPGSVRTMDIGVVGYIQATSTPSTTINTLYEAVRTAIKADITRGGNAQNTMIRGVPTGFKVLFKHPYYKFVMIVRVIVHSDT
jgi:uncharacterized protein (DUF2235 family)